MHCFNAFTRCWTVHFYFWNVWQLNAFSYNPRNGMIGIGPFLLVINSLS